MAQTFRQPWCDALAWALAQFEGTPTHNADQPVNERRRNSTSWLDLTGAVDLVTGGAVGAPGGNYIANIANVKQGTMELCRVLSFKMDVQSIDGKKFLVPLDEIESAGPCGFSSPTRH